MPDTTAPPATAPKNKFTPPLPFSIALGCRRLRRAVTPISENSSSSAAPANIVTLDVDYPLILATPPNDPPPPADPTTPYYPLTSALYHALPAAWRARSQKSTSACQIFPLTADFITALTHYFNHLPPPNDKTTPTKDFILTKLSYIEKAIEKTAPAKNAPQPPTPHHPYHRSEWIISVLSTPTAPPQAVTDIYQRLMLLSARVYLPHRINLTGIFSLLPNIVWSSHGPILSHDFNLYRLMHAQQNAPPLTVSHVDKFPYLVQYHIPSHVRIADGARVRLGAYLGNGTTVMPAGYVNFNAGTKGNAMIEGRVSAGVTLDKDSDLGGGASVMGTLSGGGKEVITIAPQCLIGANGGTGISLGQGCTIAAGVYVTAGAKVHLYDHANRPCSLSGTTVAAGANIVKARTLSGRENLLFYVDSASGHLICKPNPQTSALNPILHKN